MRPCGQAAGALRPPKIGHTQHQLGRFRRAREPVAFIHGKERPGTRCTRSRMGRAARFSQAPPSSRLVEAGGG